ncbi:MAG: hypothetical protein FJW31_06520 [Acidobacteria bacterium]|nr:hypothetical protein [Acidobacteriota bacterium]
MPQPMPFRHRVHSGGAPARLACATCHRETGTGGHSMSLPPAQVCMGCHRTVAREKPAIATLAAAARNRRRIAWEPVWFRPEFVRFSHHTHRASACAVCHGPVAERDALWREVETNMKFCRVCHEQNGARIEGGTCHAER